MNNICNYCIEFMKLYADTLGITYGQANCILFNILEPLVCILLISALFITNSKYVKFTHVTSWIILSIFIVTCVFTFIHESMLYEYVLDVPTYISSIEMFGDSFLDRWCEFTIKCLYKIAEITTLTYSEINVILYVIIIPIISIISYFISKKHVKQI